MAKNKTVKNSPTNFDNALYGVLTKRQRLENLRAQMENERSSFIADWRDLGRYIAPRRPRFFSSDANKGQRRNQEIIDGTGTLALRTLKSGMMGGITSPARPWMKLQISDPTLSQSGAVKDWLYKTTEKMLAVFGKSNLYNALPIVYGDMATFATSAMLIEEDLDEVFRCSVFPIGSYALALDDKLRVNTFYREFELTVTQIIEKFGKKTPEGNPDWKSFNWGNFSSVVRTAVENAQWNQKVTVRHFIVPNFQYDPKQLGPKGKKFASLYYEAGIGGDQTGYTGMDNERFLREAGYDLFPVLGPRWEVTGEDVYGTDCPGNTAIGDVKSLQVMQKRLAQAIEKMVNPPMTGPTALRNTKTSLLPGDITYQDVREGQLGFRPVHEINFRVNDLENLISQCQGRINKAFFADLLLMMSEDERAQPATATEVTEKKEEKLLAFGPVLEQLNQDLLNPLVTLVFSFMLKQGLIDPAPPELHGQPLKVEYTSIMAQAQKLLGISASERFVAFVSQIGAIIPSVYDVVDGDELVTEYALQTSIVPKGVRDPAVVAQMRSQRQKAQQAQQQAQMAEQQSKAAKNLAQAPTDTDNALTQLMKSGQAGNNMPQR